METEDSSYGGGSKEKKMKKLPTDIIQSPDEDDQDEEDGEPLPEGFCLQAEAISVSQSISRDTYTRSVRTSCQW